MKWFFVFAFLFCDEVKSSKKWIKFSEKAILQVEVAESMEDRYRGLMGRTSLAENNGMLFIFPEPQKLSFWMKDTFIPLSIAYLDKDGVIKEIYDMKAQKMLEKEQDLISYPSQCDCVYALEVNKDWFKKNKIKVGDKMQILSVPSKRKSF